MNKIVICTLFAILLFSCKKSERDEILQPEINFEINDDKYIVSDNFKKGDVRRYGVYPNKVISAQKIKQVITLASQGLPITFPQGHYNTNLILTNATNINFIFNDATINGAVNMLDGCSKIKLDGKLTILDKLFIRKSNHILFDTLQVKTDTIANLYNKRNRGVSIYAGSKNIAFNNLIIDDTGGEEDEFYKYTAAALQIHGWNNNPENVYINSLEILNAARSAVYITGNSHEINKVTISAFGLGTGRNMFGLEDAETNSEKEFTGLWINKCNDCLFENVSINTNTSKGKYSLKLEEGQASKPSFIFYLKLIESRNKSPILDDKLTNILIKKVDRE